MVRSVIATLLLVWIDSSDISAATRRRAVRHPGPVQVAAPVAAADSYSLTEGTTLTIAAPGVLANDTLNSAVIASCGPATGAEVTALGGTFQTAHGGALTLAAGGGFTYTPATAFRGTDTFKYFIGNAGGSSSAIVTMVVRAADPAAVDDSYSTPPESLLTVPAPGVLANDTLAGGRIVSFGASTGNEQTTLSAATQTLRGGTIALSSDGSFTYSPPPAYDDGYGGGRPFLGTDSFRYVIRTESTSIMARVTIVVEMGSEP